LDSLDGFFGVFYSFVNHFSLKFRGLKLRFFWELVKFGIFMGFYF